MFQLVDREKYGQSKGSDVCGDEGKTKVRHVNVEDVRVVRR